MPNLTPTDVHTDRELSRARRKKRKPKYPANMRVVKFQAIDNHVEDGKFRWHDFRPIWGADVKIAKHGHKGDLNYQMLHPGPSTKTGNARALRSRGIVTSKLDILSLDAQATIVSAHDLMMDKLGEVDRPPVTSIAVLPMKDIHGTDAIADYMPSRSVRIAGNWFKKKNSYEPKSSGWTVGNDIGSIYIHEAAHGMVDHSNKVMLWNGAMKIMKKYDLYEPYNGGFRISDQGQSAVSRYGSTNMNEFLAEAWTLYVTKKETHPAVQEIGKLMTRLYKRGFKGADSFAALERDEKWDSFFIITPIPRETFTMEEFVNGSAIEKHGHKGEPGYELLHPGRGRSANLPLGWSGSSKEGVFNGPDDYRLTYDPQDKGGSWLLSRKADARGRSYTEISRHKTPTAAIGSSRKHLRGVKLQHAERARAEAAFNEVKENQKAADADARGRRRQLSALPVRVAGKKPNKGSNPVATWAVDITLPGPADPVNVTETKTKIKSEYAYVWEKDYARRILRNAEKGNLIDPLDRQIVAGKVGASEVELKRIENFVLTNAFPNDPTVIAPPRKKRTQIGITNPTGMQEHAINDHGGRKIHVLMGNKRTGRNAGVVFKATKGEHRGKFVMAAWNGHVNPITDYEFKSMTDASVKNDKAEMDAFSRLKWSHVKGKFITTSEWEADKVSEQKKLDEDAADKQNDKARKIGVAAKWASDMGFDPTDSFWWAFYWNDNSLLNSGNDPDTHEPEVAAGRAPIRVGDKPGKQKIVAEQIPAGELPLGRRKRSIKGWRLGGGVVIAEHKKSTRGGNEAGDYRLYQHGKEISNKHYPTLSEAMIALTRWMDWVKNRNRKRVLATPDVSQRRMRGHKPGPARDVGDIDKRDWVESKHPRMPRGSDRGGEFASTLPNAVRFHTSSARRSAATAGVPQDGPGIFDHSKKSLKPGVKIPRPAHGKPHITKYPGGGPMPKKKYTPEQAIYARNNGATKISDVRLKALKADPSSATQQEIDLLLSAATSWQMDGRNLIRGVPTVNSGKVNTPRNKVMSDAAVAIARHLASNRRSVKRGDRGQIILRTDARGVKAKEKDREKKANNGRHIANAQALVLADKYFGDENGTCVCIFCGDKVPRKQVSPERLKPERLGGDYWDIANLAPSCRTCNIGAATDAQHYPKEYYENSMVRFMDYYETLPAATRKKLGPWFRKHRSRLGAHPDGRNA